MKTIKSFFILLIIAAIGAGSYLYFHDTHGPKIQLTPNKGCINLSTPLTLTLSDSGTSIASVSVTVGQNGQQLEVLNTNYPVNTRNVTESLNLAPMLLQDGVITVHISCRDNAIYHFGQGNTSSATFNFLIDRRPPLITVLSNAHNLNLGGAGLVVYNIAEPVTSTGLKIGDHFFPAHQQSSGTYLCLFAFPYDVTADTIPRIIASDKAGNNGVAGFYYHLNQHKFKVDTININDRFLNSKMPQFHQLFPAAKTPLAVFLSVNRILRPKNRAWLHEVSTKTHDTFTWNKSFLRQPNAATRATFGDRRHYMYAGKEIDQQRHLGIDLASTARAQVPASNSGTIVYADFMGIYGQCVIIDHGLGLQTLYGHLSTINVAVGDTVERGQTIGRTGSTGLAGGDHLHFGVIIGGVPVNPIEWWDKNWVLNNITSKLSLKNVDQ